jgi:hypothetical protein
MKQSKKWQVSLLFLVFLLGGLVLSACGDDPVPGPRDTYVQQAINAVNGGTPIPFPTANPEMVINLQLILSGGRTNGNKNDPVVYYSRLVSPAPVIGLTVINVGLTTVYVSSCEGTILQRKEGDKWLNIARARKCGSKPRALEIPKGIDQNLSLELLKADLYPGQSFYIDGTYRLVVPYSLSCPTDMADYSQCINRYAEFSTDFLLQQSP